MLVQRALKAWLALKARLVLTDLPEPQELSDPPVRRAPRVQRVLQAPPEHKELKE
jgi:hypothetical protein